jgi:two-component system sensor histidine kinase ChiS
MLDKGAGETTATQGRILIVEDEEALARHLGSHLQRAGFEVRMEHTGKAALLIAAEHWPDLVLLDLVLPDISGYEVCTELRRIYRPWHLPVLMLTALNSPKHRLLGFGHGADAYLTKPVSSGELVRTIATLLSHNVRGLGAGG